MFQFFKNFWEKLREKQNADKALRLKKIQEQNELCLFVLDEIKRDFNWKFLKKDKSKTNGFNYKSVNIWKFLNEDIEVSYDDYCLFVGDDKVESDIETKEKLFNFLNEKFYLHQQDRIKASLNEIKNE